MIDDEENPLTIISVEKPSFATISGLIYKFKPTVISHIGTFTVKGKVSDSKLTLPFSFNVKVFVDPVKFDGSLQDQVLSLQSTKDYTLPNVVS